MKHLLIYSRYNYIILIMIIIPIMFLRLHEFLSEIAVAQTQKSFTSEIIV